MKLIDNSRPTILCLIDYYLPAFKAGGAIRSLSNLIANLGGLFNFQVLTRDTDIGDSVSYEGICSDDWAEGDGANIYYISYPNRNIWTIWRICKNLKYDILYINSIYSVLFSIAPLLLRRLGMLPRGACIIAPRGEFSAGAMAYKSTRKRAYIFVALTLGLFKEVTWQASSEDEALDIYSATGCVGERIVIAPDLAVCESHYSLPSWGSRQNEGGIPRVIFLSRISPIKNLDFLLRVFSRIEIAVRLSIYGPRDDSIYWARCTSLIEDLPANIEVEVHGAVVSSEVGDLFAKHDLFAFPTLGENYGHVIIESLASGTPVLVSDKTFWQSDGTNALRVLALDEETWLKSLNEILNDVTKLRHERDSAMIYAKNYNSNPELLAANKRLFLRALLNGY